MIHIPRMFIPSFYGDIRLEPDGDKATKLTAERLTAAEKTALVALSKVAIGKDWYAPDAGVIGEGTHRLDAPVLKVQKVLTKLLKPGRKMVTAVKFSDGTMEEVAAAEYDEDGAVPASPGGGPYREKADVPALARTEKKEKAEAGVSVAKPTQGCPAPDFVRAEIKARAVLEQFLDDEQLEDFRRYNRFMSVGAETGHQYLITSRHAKDTLAVYGRQLFDITDDTPFCVHDYAVPAAEEMLALHVMLRTPGHENYLRHLE